MKQTLLVLLLWCVAFSGLVFAQSGLESFSKPLPELELLPEAAFEEQTQHVENTPAGLETLRFSIRLPKGWTEETQRGFSGARLNSIVLSPLVTYIDPQPAPTRSRFTLSAMALDYEVTALQWLIRRITEQGLGIEGVQDHGPARAEILYVRLDGDISVAVRAIAAISGGTLVFAEYLIPIDRWPEEKAMQAQSIQSFELLSAQGGEDLNRLRYDFLDIASFAYPENWDLRPAPLRSADRMSAVLYNISAIQGQNRRSERIQNGRIEIQLISRGSFTGLDSEADRQKSALIPIGLSVEGVIDRVEEIPPAEGFDLADHDIYQASDSRDILQDYEFWVTVLQEGDYYYYVTLITPSKGEDFINWSQNSQTYKAVIRSLRARAYLSQP